jgi:hypothetical protein
VSGEFHPAITNKSRHLISTGELHVEEVGSCKRGRKVEQLDLLFDPVFNKDQNNFQIKAINEINDALKKLDFKASYMNIFSSMWHTGTPCFNLHGSSVGHVQDPSLLRFCQWKGLEVPCSAIFSSFPTDQGMCCSFNMKAAEDIFIGETYSRLIQNLQAIDKSALVKEVKNQPDSRIFDHGEPKTEPGKSKGLTVILDAHSNLFSASSVTLDTQGFVGLISNSGSFSQTSLGGFDIKPGHNNLVAITGKIISSDSSLVDLDYKSRNCYFEWENSILKMHKNYTQPNCIFECDLYYAISLMKIKYNSSTSCIPWYFPSPDVSPIVCDPWQAAEMYQLMSNVPDQECQHCIPDCQTTIFKTRVTAVPFRNCSLLNAGGNDAFCHMYNPTKINLNMLSDLLFFNIIQHFKTLPYYFERKFLPSNRKYGSNFANGEQVLCSTGSSSTIQK